MILAMAFHLSRGEAQALPINMVLGAWPPSSPGAGRRKRRLGLLESDSDHDFTTSCFEPSHPDTSKLPLSEHDAHLVHDAVVANLDVAAGVIDAIYLEPGDAAIHAVRVLDGDPVLGAAGLERHLVSWPRFRNARVDVERAAAALRPRMASTPTRYIQPAEPVYQVHPPRPVCGGCE